MAEIGRTQSDVQFAQIAGGAMTVIVRSPCGSAEGPVRRSNRWGPMNVDHVAPSHNVAQVLRFFGLDEEASAVRTPQFGVGEVRLMAAE